MAMRFSTTLTAGLVAGLALMPAGAAATPPVPARAATAQSVAAVLPAADPTGTQRLAFTDDRDHLAAKDVTRSGSATTYAYVAGDPVAVPGIADIDTSRHTGELSSASDGTGTSAFIRTSPDDPQGDVFVSIKGGEPFAITCNNTAIASHPVVRLIEGDGIVTGVDVAYAANSGSGYDLWVSHVDPAGKGDRCATPRVQVTDNSADDLWPAWVPDGSGLVFSSMRDDALGDIYRIAIPPLNSQVNAQAMSFEPGSSRLTAGPAAKPKPKSIEQGLLRLTTGTAAETQPTATLRVKKCASAPQTSAQAIAIARLWDQG